MFSLEERVMSETNDFFKPSYIFIDHGSVLIERRPATDAYAVHLAKHVGQETFVVREIVTDKVEDDILFQPLEPPLLVGHQMCQQFLDELWRAGFRPSRGRHTAGELKATQAHLQDMQGMTERLLTAVLEAK